MKIVLTIIFLLFVFFGKLEPSFSEQEPSIVDHSNPLNSINERSSVKSINLHTPQIENQADASLQSVTEDSDSNEYAETFEDDLLFNELLNTLTDDFLEYANEQGITWDELLSQFFDTPSELEVPTNFEATIRAYDPSKPKEIEEDDISWENFLDALLTDYANDDTLLDQESLNALLEDWMVYVNYLKNILSGNDELEAENLMDSMFEGLDKDLKNELSKNEIFKTEQLLTKGKNNEIEQTLLLDTVDALTFALEDKIVSSIDDAELFDKFLEALEEIYPDQNIDQLTNEYSQGEPSTSKTHNSLDSYNLQNQQDNLNNKVSSCSDFTNDKFSCEQIPHCQCSTESSNCMCSISPEHMNYLVDSGCKQEPKASILSVARDLVNEGYMDQPTLSHLTSLQDNDAICRSVTHSYFSSTAPQQQNSKDSFDFNSSDWNELSPKGKLEVIMSLIDNL